ncbi:MAG: hypothetical protein HC837_12585 [Chloroflexaceae bacterium]|nr:hypothetical protein [Chloroflexaceae bacterium]
MDFFGVGPLEFFFILILGLILLGPERLPQVARHAGQLVARVLAWQQQSPEGQMVQQIRKDFEQEIVALRNEIIQAKRDLNLKAALEELGDQTIGELPTEEQTALAGRKAKQPARSTTQSVATAKPAAAAEPAPAVNAPENRTTEATETVQPMPYGTPTNTVPRQNKRPSTATRTANGQLNGSAQAAVPVPTVQAADLAALAQQIEQLRQEISQLREQMHLRDLLNTPLPPADNHSSTASAPSTDSWPT